MRISKILLLGQPQCPLCFVPLQNSLNIDTTNYENNTAVFIHPPSIVCKNDGLATKPFLLKNFVYDLDTELDCYEIEHTGQMETPISPQAENGTVTEFPVDSSKGDL